MNAPAYRIRVERDILDLLDYVDRQDGPSAIRGGGPGLQAAYDRMVTAAEVAAEARAGRASFLQLRGALTALRGAVRAYRASMQTGRPDYGYESD